MIIASPATLKRAAKHLTEHDPVLAPIIAQAGLPTLAPNQNYYWSLIDSIISQQLSVKAAASIEKRFLELFTSDVPTPDAILSKSIDQLRAAGLSGAKANYIRDLAQHIIDGQLKFDRFPDLSNDAIIDELTAVKGVGEWTAQMFLMFCMGRLDVLASGDLGIRNGVRALYLLPALPIPAQVSELAALNHWQPYASAACWYVWHSLDNAPTS